MKPPTATTTAKYFLGFDIDVTGHCMKTNFMPRFGAKLVEVSSGKVMETFETFCRPGDSDADAGLVWCPDHLQSFWIPRRERYDRVVKECARAPTPARAGELFVEWIKVISDRYGSGSIMLVSECAGIDYAWISTVLPKGTSLLYLFGRYTPIFASTGFYWGPN